MKPNIDPPIRTVILPIKYLWLYLNSKNDTKQWFSRSNPALITFEQPRRYQTVILPVKCLWSYLNSPDDTDQWSSQSNPSWSHLNSQNDTKQWSSQSDPSDHIQNIQVIPNSDPPSQTPLIISEQPRWYLTLILPLEQPKWYQRVILPVKPLWSHLNGWKFKISKILNFR